MSSACGPQGGIPAGDAVPQDAAAFTWSAAMPESQGLSSEKLFVARDTLAMKRTNTLLVIRNDNIVLE